MATVAEIVSGGLGVWLAVALGGALGAVARYGASVALAPLVGAAFYGATLAINVLGSLLLGALFAASQAKLVGVGTVSLLGVGVLGAFTTFSTFAVELLRLVTAGRALEALGYALASVALSFAAAWLGLATMQWVGR